MIWPMFAKKSSFMILFYVMSVSSDVPYLLSSARYLKKTKPKSTGCLKKQRVLPNWAFSDLSRISYVFLPNWKLDLQMLHLINLSFFRHPVERQHATGKRENYKNTWPISLVWILNMIRAAKEGLAWITKDETIKTISSEMADFFKSEMWMKLNEGMGDQHSLL